MKKSELITLIQETVSSVIKEDSRLNDRLKADVSSTIDDLKKYFESYKELISVEQKNKGSRIVTIKFSTDNRYFAANDIRKFLSKTDSSDVTMDRTGYWFGNFLCYDLIVN